MTDAHATICWHRPFPRCNCPEPEVFLSYGRVRSGKRWFWHVSGWKRRHFDEQYDDYGWADSEAEAVEAAKQSITAIAAGRQTGAGVRHYGAAMRLKELNRSKRAARPASDATDARPTEYLFGVRSGIHDDGWDTPYYHIYVFPIVKKTAKRIYYKRKRLDRLPEIDAPDISESAIRDFTHQDHDIGFVDRQELEAKGEVYNHGRHWSEDDFYLLAKPPAPRETEPDTPDLAELKAAMAAAHPDRGGSNAAFIEARRRYVEARARARVEPANAGLAPDAARIYQGSA